MYFPMSETHRRYKNEQLNTEFRKSKHGHGFYEVIAMETTEDQFIFLHLGLTFFFQHTRCSFKLVNIHIYLITVHLISLRIMCRIFLKWVYFWQEWWITEYLSHNKYIWILSFKWFISISRKGMNSFGIEHLNFFLLYFLFLWDKTVG